MIAETHVRIARPSRDLDAAERFWCQGLGLKLLHRADPVAGDPSQDHALRMVGAPGGGWHLELVRHPAHRTDPRPTSEDLLVLYLDGPVPDELVRRLEESGGRRVPAANPYWDRWGVTIQDPDGYRLVLSTRAWANE